MDREKDGWKDGQQTEGRMDRQDPANRGLGSNKV